MKATKLMALGLVGLTTLGLASTANAEEKESTETVASITFTSENIPEDQEGENGQEVHPDNPIAETNPVQGWMLGVPDELKFKGKDTTIDEDSGKNLYNSSVDINKYVSRGTRYADGSYKDFILRFRKDTKAESFGKDYAVTVERDVFKVDGKNFDEDQGGRSSIKIATSKAKVLNPLSSGELADNSAIIGAPKYKEVDLTQAGKSGTLIEKVELDNSKGFGLIGIPAEDITMTLGGGSKMLGKGSHKLTTTLTWSLISGAVTGNDGE